MRRKKYWKKRELLNQNSKNNMKKTIVLFSISTLFTGCGIYSNYQPQTSVPDNLYGEEVDISDTTNIGNIKWCDFFKDKYLLELIERGIKNNTDVRTAQLRVEEAKASLLSAKLSFLPSFAFAPQGSITHVESQTSRTYTLPVTASWEIDLFGKLRNAKRQAQAALIQSEDYKQAVYSELVSNIANTYYTLLMLDEQLRISKETAQSWEETVSSTQALMDAGLADESAVSQMKATYFEVKNSVIDLEEQINQTENTLALLLAETPHSFERGKLAEQNFSAEWSVGVPLQILSNRPDVRMAERSLEQAFYVTNQANAAFYPSITLSGSAGWTNSLGEIISNPGKFLASAVGSLTEPLFNRGTLIAQRRIAKAQQEEALLAFNQSLLDAGVEVNDALVSYQVSKKKRENYESQISSLQNALRSVSLLMQNGNTTYLEVLTAKQSLLSAELAQVANCFKEIQSMINLYQALGGGQEL